MSANEFLRKLIFSADIPWGNGNFRVAAVVYARISEEAKRQILGENGAKLFKIDLTKVQTFR